VKWLTTGLDRRWGLALCAALVLSIVTLESSAFMIVGVLCCVVIWVRGLGRRARVPWLRRYVLPGAVVVVVATAVLWPGMLLKGAFIKVPAERFYQVFLGESQVYYLTGSADVLAYLLPVLLAVPAVAYLVARHRQEAKRWGPLVVLAVVYVALVIRFAVSDTYWLPAMAPLLLLAAWAVGLLTARARAAALVAAVVVMAVGYGSILHGNTSTERNDRRTRADFAFVADFVGGSRALLDGGHIFQYYLPRTNITEISFNPKQLLEREEGEYVTLPRSAYAGTVVGILSKRGSFLNGAGGATLSSECPKTARPTIVLWDCRRLSP
jgi:4-amino-4-deoxy-L-arabinose transferase-like glycosyltransferase